MPSRTATARDRERLSSRTRSHCHRRLDALEIGPSNIVLALGIGKHAAGGENYGPYR